MRLVWLRVFRRLFADEPALIWTFCCCLCGSAVAQVPSDYAVRVSATVQAAPAQVTLAWPSDPEALYCAVSRKSPTAAFWGPDIELDPLATNYVDTNVVRGGSYEYRLYRIAPAYDSYGYLCSGIESPLVESRGKVVLLVDETMWPPLELEIQRLEQDLVGDGWEVVRHLCPRMTVAPEETSPGRWAARSNELFWAKALVKSDYLADPDTLKALMIIGHIPVPYSGDLYPDAHANHRGAWPADGFFADLDGIWTDFSLTSLGASDPRNLNQPGDGKFDQTQFPSNLELQLGRVDFANMPAFPEGELELLRRYFNKDHGFRHGLLSIERRGLVEDGLGLATGEAFAANGWRDFAPFFGPTNTFAADWLSTQNTQGYLWGYGCGAGTFTSCGGVANTSQLAASDPRIVFTMAFGSYFGDWDSTDNLLRALIATPGFSLTSAWVGRPFWFFHHMALGETVGFSARLSQNDDGSLYSGSGYRRFASIALMGDPTLRMHMVAPPAAFAVVSNGAAGVELSWIASPDTVVGYHVYQAATSAGPFTRINSNLVTSTTYVVPEATTNVYMVRAVKLEVSGSGSYFNASQGIFQSLDGSAGLPMVVLRQPTNDSVFLAPANIPLAATTLDPANGITNVAFYANGVKIRDAGGISQTAVWSNAPVGAYSVTARISCRNGLVTNSSPASVIVAGEPPVLMMSIAAGVACGSGVGQPGKVYRVEIKSSLTETNWQPLLNTTSGPAGSFQFTDISSTTQKFYRVVFP